MISEQNVLQTLKSRFGFDAFKPGQSEIISALLADESVMAMLPTGGGKSLIYQMVGYLRPGVTIIVTPLLSLMQDQVARLNYQGERAVVAFNSTLTGYERQRVLARLGQYRFVFISPEMLSQEDVISAFQQVDINLMVIDEAHTMLTWGPDFRPDYLALPQIHERLNTPQLLLLTATATPEMLAKLKDDFAKETRKWFTYVESVNRPNIYLHTEHFTQRQDKKERLASLITTLKGPGLVYFSSRKQATAMARELQRETGKRIAAYHGGLESTERFRIQQQFMLGQLDVIMATSAFGMGIDKDNIRYVIHYHMSSDIPNYLQEFGRAGRNGDTAVAILLFAPGDEQLHYGLIDQTIPEKQAIQAFYETGRIKSPEQQRLLAYYQQAGYSEIDVKNIMAERREKRYADLDKMRQYANANGRLREQILMFFSESIQEEQKAFESVGQRKWHPEELGLVGETVPETTTELLDWQQQLQKMFKKR
ncbi:RecQ family ATP-dependent DNA helicase [Weissella tructae]|uniref:ATP-dependent DNA helicase, RecQ family n=2 Tax=Weissella TaxID=46255 RepID=A0A075TVS5_9LACO|nr:MULTISPECIES: RecQ family ATP-dependent DNA helicase [Weissella]AIG65664.1 ATP-dependent DNA helicase, RecQ family [Weissella tructae]AIM62979.1 ATP-dependent DNA helicase, RecQ family [Weissella ceti]ELA06882.1 ATP-dependent DNA helicase RecQ [Weissella ceti NC36]QVV90784.1 RecQ family ATP-dependent DNA helicase [Weissella tructae]